MRTTAGRWHFLRADAAIIAVLITTLSSVGCSTAGSSQSGDAVTASDARSAPSGSQTAGDSFEAVRFTTDDRVELRGRVWSEGRIGIVLAHGFSQHIAQDAWDAFADYLAGLGYGVLTFDFRGFCDHDGCSEGSVELEENWRDLAPAVEYLRSRGSERIFIVAASMGGIAAFRAADEAELDLAGIVSLATPQYPSIYYDVEPVENDVTPERLQRIAAPKLFIAGANDVQLPGQAPLRPGVDSVSFADDARAMYEASPEPRQLEIVDSDRHSSELVIGAAPGRTLQSTSPEIVELTRALIVAFIEEHA